MAWQESTYKPEYCEKAVQVLSSGKSFASVCAALGCCRATLYNWRDAHPEFAKALNHGVQLSQAHWEDIGYSGTTGANPEFCATPWVFTMKSRFRDDYAKKKEDDGKNSVIEKLLEKL